MLVARVAAQPMRGSLDFSQATFWRYYTGGVDRLAWEAVRSYHHRFGCTAGWKQVTITVYDFDSCSGNDFIGKVTVPLHETEGEVTMRLEGATGKQRPTAAAGRAAGTAVCAGLAARALSRGRLRAMSGRSGAAQAGVAWGSRYQQEVAVMVHVVQSAVQLCSEGGQLIEVTAAPSQGKKMDERDVVAGLSCLKPGDSTPVTAADLAVQALAFEAVRAEFPEDALVGEEDSSHLREDPALCELAFGLYAQRGGGLGRDAFLEAVDAGRGPAAGEGRVWVIDPVDGTKGLMTGRGYFFVPRAVGLALLVDGEPVVGALGVPNSHSLCPGCPPLLVAVRGCGTRWWPASGSGPLEHRPARPTWAPEGAPEGGAPGAAPWALSPQSAWPSCAPFGAACPPTEVCCGSLVKYFAVAMGHVAGFVQCEENMMTWDHASGVVCVVESGGSVSDAHRQRVWFPGRSFGVAGGIVCVSPWSTPHMREQLLLAAQANMKP
ncbi:unnamed protein product [Prorocentrum cordatum]|uniref:C2 domain-containing protein n=1 Tax=Prorocentrum cordatum TaxID=2364126 RepID=A0ABN9S5H0_9DINO|nr:unnamed protein product [Polarella glacialis]